ncbi:structural maintenance-chromosome 4 [Fusarium flagelliforme]|uniref:Structural maintenance of chromosomes protein 4 n=2 Tax=Fusarium flagelliforme TaxID=2675880 RepID=A0A395N561_9HYPO|nr:structural maintenance-chromosome 4 [Fusarium flagelliforme]
MSSPVRPRRATRRTAIVESDDEEDVSNRSRVQDEEDFEPEPQPARRATRSGRKSTTPAPTPTAAPRPRGRPKKAPTPAPATESSAVFDADTTIKTEPMSSSPARPSPRNRKSTARSSISSVPELPPTPQAKPPKSPESSQKPMAALADISDASMNASNADDTQATIKPIKPMSTIMEKPMDIVLKSRTMAIPVVEDTTPKSRIVLTHLILNNFKSYAGRQEVGPFHASFSSVVGPNGSGKSNVIDSLLFVFGFRASKMRQGKISALIHNSAQYPNLDHCEVAVYFQEVMDQPGGGHEVIPNSELIISRKAFKNNSSKYYINGKESNFTTVTTLLRDRGVDLDHKRFLILQGEVESIAQMKAKAGNEHEDGLLEYLEDIIGTSKYKTPIEESAAEVEALNDVCMEKSGRVQHVEKEKNSLEDKKDKAIAYIRDENELAMKQSALYQLFIHKCNENLTVTEEAITQMQAQLDAELEKHHGSEQIIKSLKEDYDVGSKEFEIQSKSTQALVKEMAKFEQERVKFDEKRKFLDDKRKKLEKTIANAEATSVEADETIEQCGLEIDTRTQEIAELEEQVQTAEAELAEIRDSLKGKTQAFSDQIAAKQKSLEPWNEKINQKQSAVAVAESELNILQEKANAGAVALEDLQSKIASIEENKSAKRSELKSCQAEKAELLKEADNMKSELSVLAEQEPKIRSKISNARQKADEARSSLSNTQARGNVLSALMRMKESGRIDGFHGRLGNLGAIDPKYDVAISTACGALDNFVTETVEAGQQCIEYLRKNNVGRGNFICLDKLRRRDLSPIQTPENAPRLFDLVTAKEDKFRPAFYHAMQDTLVAADLAQANRIAYGAKRWRVVTLDGELIDKSGTMSGGGSTVKRGLMSSKLVSDVSREQVAKYESDRDGWETKFQEFQEYQRECETRLKELNEKIPQLDTRMQKIGLEIESAERNIADMQRRIKEVSKEHQPSATDNSRIAALQKEIAKLNRDIERLHGETSSVEEEIKALQDKIMEVGGEKLRAQRAKVDSIKEEISSNNEEISNAEVRKVKAEKQKIKLEKDHAKSSKELAAASRDLEKLEDDINNQGERAEELQAQVAAAEEGLAAKKKELKALKSELDEKTDELNETRAVEIEMRNKLEENQKALTENQARLRHWNDKLSKIVLQNIDDLVGGSGNSQPKRRSQPKPEQSDDGDVEMDDAPQDDVDMTDAPAEEEEGEDEEEEDEGEDEEGEHVNGQPNELPRYTPDELADMNERTLKGEIAALEEKTQNVNVDLGVLAEYRRRVEEHAARASDLQSAVEQRDYAKKRCDDLRRLRLEGFMEGFSAISLRLKEMYQMITMGGNAELELVDSLDPFSEGILFSVMPPKKSWKNISNLSGGEKTLSSLALVFALHHYKPTPLYVMDEIDAALDFRNVSIVANYIKERTKNAQFIVISLRNNMFELAARLVGVYKVNHMTKSVTIENKDFIVRPQGQQQASQRTQGGNNTTILPFRSSFQQHDDVQGQGSEDQVPCQAIPLKVTMQEDNILEESVLSISIMWMLLFFVAHLAVAFPANWNETVSCPHDALYSSLIEDDGKFCSSVLEGIHCGAGYSTPTEYVRHNQTRIASYTVGTSSDSSRATTREDSFTVEYSDTWTTDWETSASVGQPASGTYPEKTTTESKATSRSRNQTRSAFSSSVETTKEASRTGPFTNSSSPATETLDETSSKPADSRNLTTPGSPSNTRGPISESSSLFQNQTSGTRPTSSFVQSGNQTQSRPPSTDVTPQPSSTSTPEPEMTQPGTTRGSLPWSIPGNTTSSPSGSGTVSLERDYRFRRQWLSADYQSVEWHFHVLSNVTIAESVILGRSNPSGNVSVPTISTSKSGTFVSTPTPTLPFTSQSSIASTPRSGSSIPGWNSTASPSGGNTTIPTISISRTGTPVPFSTVSLPSDTIPTSEEVTSSTSSNSVAPSWNGTIPPSTSNASMPTISLTQTEISLPFPTTPATIRSFPTLSGNTSTSTRNGSVVSGWNTTSRVSESIGTGTIPSSFGPGSSVSLPTDSELSSSTTQSGGIRWNFTSSVSGVVSLPTISVPTSEIPSLPLPTDSFQFSTSTESRSVISGGNTTTSVTGSTEAVTSFSSPVPTTSTPSDESNGSASAGNATTTGVPEFPAANFTHVTRTAALSEETCYTLPDDPEGDATRRALLFNSRLREDNISIPIPYIESVEFESGGVDPLYLTVRDEEGGTYFVDISHRGRLSVADPAGFLVTLDAKGIHFSGSNCTYDISITIDDMYEQITELAGVQCAALKRQKRADDLDFSQTLYLHDQCGNVVDKSLRQYPQLLVGGTVCAEATADEDTGRWDFDCTFPGSQSGSMRCQVAVKNSVIDFIATDPFGGSCPDLSTVVTMLEESGQDIVDPSELRNDLTNRGLRTDRARQEADEAVAAYTRLWQALGAFFTKDAESSKGSLEKYIDMYNSHRSFENDICQALHEGDIPLNLTLIAGAAQIPAISTLNWAPESTRPYNITVQDSTRIACCPDAQVAEGEGDKCAYPREAIIPGTGCVCGTSAEGIGIAFEWTECGNFAGSCEADGDCGDGYLCLTGSCCGGGVCVDAYACSENGTALIRSDGGF